MAAISTADFALFVVNNDLMSFLVFVFFPNRIITVCLMFSGASLVKGIPFNPADPEVSGPDIFKKLVPLEAHKASSLYRFVKI